MNPRVTQGLSIALSTLAGFVDAQGYLALGGLFVAFMSGNSTVLGVAVVEGSTGRVALSATLVAAFVLGVMIGTWVGRPFHDRRAPVVLLLMGCLLAVAASLYRLGFAVPCCIMVSLALGAENTVFQRDGTPGIGLTYMTGTLVRLGQRIAEALTGGAWRQVVPDTLLWVGMAAGAGLGTQAYQELGLDGLWIAVAVAGVMAVTARLGLSTTS